MAVCASFDRDHVLLHRGFSLDHPSFAPSVCMEQGVSWKTSRKHSWGSGEAMGVLKHGASGLRSSKPPWLPNVQGDTPVRDKRGCQPHEPKSSKLSCCRSLDGQLLCSQWRLSVATRLPAND